MGAIGPPRNSFKVKKEGDRLVLRRRTGIRGVGVFILVWLTFWTFGCVQLSTSLVREPSLRSLLFLALFWAGWCFAIWLLLQSFLGFEQLAISPDHLELRTLFTRRSLPADEFRGLTLDRKEIQDGRRETTQPVLKIVMQGEPLLLGQGLDEDELRWMAGLIGQHLGSRASGLETESPPASALKSSARIEVLSPLFGVPGRPSDSRIERFEDWDGTTFRRRGRISFLDLAGLTLMCLFWNGVVGVFILEQIRHFKWFLFFFMMPHELIGLGLIVSWLATLVRPFRDERWVFSSGEITARWSLFGISLKRSWDPGEVCQVELRQGQARRRPWFTTSEGEPGRDCSLVLLGGDGSDLLRIASLTEGEARWLGGEICLLLKDSLKAPAAEPGPVESLYDRWLDG
jgi:hypothetical protein